MEPSPLSSLSPPFAARLDDRRSSLLARWIGPRIPVSNKARLAAAATALVCSAVLTIASLLTPDSRGYGTHQQLGGNAFAPCGTMLVTGYPCPTCGMTTAFAHVMHGHPIAALLAQPTGMLLCLATIAAVAVSIRIALTGRAPTVNWHRFAPVPVALALSFFFIGGWAFKVVHGLLAGTLPVR
ncbi:MAG TPA: DUF2752 domain-containing protein [Phycisphaerae bacterium]|nr:DUF2752 domain-containing protein [Phycisphaerae bacterium]